MDEEQIEVSTSSLDEDSEDEKENSSSLDEDSVEESIDEEEDSSTSSSSKKYPTPIRNITHSREWETIKMLLS